MQNVMRGEALVAAVLTMFWNGTAIRGQEAAPKPAHEYTLQVSGKWQNPAEKPKAAPVATLATPYPDNERDFPGKGPARKFGFMQGERDAFLKQREKDQGAIVFVGDSLTGGWKNLAQDFAGFKVANRGVGGDTSRNVLFRFKEDVLDLNPKAIVIEIGNNDLTAMGRPADTLSNVADIVALAEKERPDLPIVLCSIPPSANPKAPVKTEARRAINEGLRKLAAERPTRRFCDLFAALANADGAPKAEYFGGDKLHVNNLGHSKWAELLKPILNEMNVR
jgi:lysophospholipase L1-like esterase